MVADSQENFAVPRWYSLVPAEPLYPPAAERLGRKCWLLARCLRRSRGRADGLHRFHACGARLGNLLVPELFALPTRDIARDHELFGVQIGRYIIHVDAAARAGLARYVAALRSIAVTANVAASAVTKSTNVGGGLNWVITTHAILTHAAAG